MWGKGGIVISMSQREGFTSELIFEQDTEGIREMAVQAFRRTRDKCGCERQNSCKNLQVEPTCLAKKPEEAGGARG